MIIVKTPELAESVAEATLLDWQKQPGDAVAEGEILVSVETDKIVLEVYAPQGGVLQEILKKEGDSVVSDEPLARIDETAQAASAPRPRPRRKRPKNRNPRPPPPLLQPPPPRRANRRRCLRRAKSRPSAASNCPRSKAAVAAAESQNPTRSRRRLNLLLPLPPPDAKRNASR